MNKTNELAETGMSYDKFLEIAGNGIKVPDSWYMRALYSQAWHETAGFTSRIWKETKNIFGMRPSVSRHKFYDWKLTTATGDYAGYDKHVDSINDRVDLDRNFKRPTDLQDLNDVEGYMLHVKEKGYATDPTYVSKWATVYKQIFGDTAPEGLDVEDSSSSGRINRFGGIIKIALLLAAVGGIFWAIKKRKNS